MPSWSDKLKPMRCDLKPLMPEADAAYLAAERAANLMPGLPVDLKHTTKAQRRQFLDIRQAKTAADLLERLPEPDEAFHCVAGGRFAMWDIVPAVLFRAKPRTIESLTIATLGFSKNNADALCKLLDEKQIGRVTVLCSHYFSATSKDILKHMVAGMEHRGQTLAIRRSHAKILAMKLTGGQTMTVEASSNLRSSKNCENMSFFGDPALYQFHTRWIEEICK